MPQTTSKATALACLAELAQVLPPPLGRELEHVLSLPKWVGWIVVLKSEMPR